MNENKLVDWWACTPRKGDFEEMHDIQSAMNIIETKVMIQEWGLTPSTHSAQNLTRESYHPDYSSPDDIIQLDEDEKEAWKKLEGMEKQFGMNRHDHIQESFLMESIRQDTDKKDISDLIDDELSNMSEDDIGGLLKPLNDRLMLIQRKR